MWVVYSIHEPGKVYYLNKCHVYTIGRQASHLLIPKDSSISRHHADLIVERDANGQFLLYVVDHSKYGSYLNNKKLVKGTKTIVLKGSILELGARKSSFKFDVINFNFRTSSLNAKDKELLKRMASEIGAKIVSSVDEATHIVTNQITLTMKVMMGLVKGIPIVATSYVKELCSNSQWNRPLPSPENFGPFIISEECNSEMLKIRPERKTLLKNKTFVFLSKDQHSFYSSLIEYASGRVVDLTNKIEEFGIHKLEQYIEENKFNLWINPISNNANSSEKLMYIVQLIEKKGINFINVEEIAKSILHVDIVNFCNPKFPNNDEDNENLSTSALLDQTKYIISQIKKKNAEQTNEMEIKNTKKTDPKICSIDEPSLTIDSNGESQRFLENMIDEIESNNSNEDPELNIFESLLDLKTENLPERQDDENISISERIDEKSINNEPQSNKESIFDIDYDQFQEVPDHSSKSVSEKEEPSDNIYNFKRFKKQKLMSYSDIVITVTFENK